MLSVNNIVDYSFINDINATTIRIKKQENLDRLVTTYCLNEIFNRDNINISISGTALTDNVDLKCCISTPAITKNIHVEIKERQKTLYQIKTYGDVELKSDKLKLMKNTCDSDTALLYVVLLNQQYCYIFNINKIDFSNLKSFNWQIKKTEFSLTSTTDNFITYSIPLSKAICCVDCSKYYDYIYKNYSEIVTNNNADNK